MDSCYYELLMEQALLEAKKGFNEGEVPVGAVIASPEGNIVASAHNQPIGLNEIGRASCRERVCQYV
jgi:tRNA(adenine34) deaminase